MRFSLVSIVRSDVDNYMFAKLLKDVVKSVGAGDCGEMFVLRRVNFCCEWKFV